MGNQGALGHLVTSPFPLSTLHQTGLLPVRALAQPRNGSGVSPKVDKEMGRRGGGVLEGGLYVGLDFD